MKLQAESPASGLLRPYRTDDLPGTRQAPNDGFQFFFREFDVVVGKDERFLICGITHGFLDAAFHGRFASQVKEGVLGFAATNIAPFPNQGPAETGR